MAGAELRVDDHSLICLRSTAVANGVTRSRIVPLLPEGSVVSTPRHHTGVVITEHGSADLSGLTVRRAGRGAGRDRPPRLPGRAPQGGRHPRAGTDPVADPVRRPSCTLATFNVHMGVDGWGRPYDIVGPVPGRSGPTSTCCRSRGPPTTGARAPPPGSPRAWGTRSWPRWPWPTAASSPPIPRPVRRWGPPLLRPRKTLRLDGEHWTSAKEPGSRSFVRGRWGMALLSRVPVRDVEVIPLGQLRRDSARRAVIRGVVDLEGGPIVVHGTHMSHITHGSHAQYRLLGTKLPPVTTAAVLAGDMNLWGPPVVSYVRGLAASRHRPDLARPAPPQPARPHPGHPPGAGHRGPGRRVRRLRPPSGGGHAGLS